MKKMIQNWDDEEKAELIRFIEQNLPIYSIEDIRVVGSYVFGGTLKDMDVVIIVTDNVDSFRLTRKFNGELIDFWVHNKKEEKYKIFEMPKIGRFDLPQYSLFTNKMIGGKQEDIDRWKKCKEGRFVEMRGNRVWNGTIPVSDKLKLIHVKGGIGGILE